MAKGVLSFFHGICYEDDLQGRIIVLKNFAPLQLEYHMLEISKISAGAFSLRITEITGYQHVNKNTYSLND